MLKTTKLTAVLAIAGLVLALAPAAQAASILDTDPLATAYGLSDGDTFRMVFVTSTTFAASSKFDPGSAPTDIAFYNGYVNDVANNLDGNTGSIVASYDFTWKVIGSTNETDNAINNTGTTGTGFPIYLVGGGASQVADTYTDLWDGDIDRMIDRYETGVQWTTGESTRVYTGSNTDGTVRTPLGAGWPTLGDLEETAFPQAWVQIEEGAGPNRYYGLSEEISVVPEPATMSLLAIGGLGLLARRKRRA